MRMIRRAITAALIAVLGFVAIGAQPAAAHTAMCSTSCNGLTEFAGSYMDVAPSWCYNSSGTTDIASVSLIDTYSNSNAHWTMKIVNYDTGAVKYNGGSVYLGYLDNHFWDLETSGPSAETGGDWYMYLEMDPDIGFTTIWRLAVKHATGHGAPFTSATDIDTIAYSQSACS